ncbi:uncharacterized protein [Clytia hemisphaerica]|uniref:Cnidarian restricted protein n=1 Tax=Clytia hemisphaerica TaxID=252671 RepID=A0A7M5X1C8_9CNID
MKFDIVIVLTSVLLLISRPSLVLTLSIPTDTWIDISDICKIDFEGNVQFYSNGGFRQCNDELCPMESDPGPFGKDCRACCINERHKLKSADRFVRSEEQSGCEGNSVESNGEKQMIIIVLGVVVCLLSLCIIIMVVITIRKKSKSRRQCRRAGSKESNTSSTSQIREDVSAKKLGVKDSVLTISNGTFELVTSRPSIRNIPGIKKDKPKQNSTAIVEETETNSLLDSNATTNV